MEKILCAAIWHNDGESYPHGPYGISTGLVVCGFRHCDCIVVLATAIPNRNKEKDFQGFLTSDNRFVSRKSAMRIAFTAGQLIKETRSVELFSEDLY